MAGFLSRCRHEDEADLWAAVSAGGKGRLRMDTARPTRKRAVAPRKNGSSLCAAVQATMSEQKTAPTPQKKFSRLTAPAFDAVASEGASGTEAEVAPISAISRLSVGTINPIPKPQVATEPSPSQSDPK